MQVAGAMTVVWCFRDCSGRLAPKPFRQPLAPHKIKALGFAGSPKP